VRTRLRLLAVAALTATGLVLSGCSDPGPSYQPRGDVTPFRFHPPMPAGSGPVAVAVGDMVCAPGDRVTVKRCRDADAAELAQDYRPDYLLALGDEQYGNHGLEDYEKGYAKTWGKLRSVTKPVPGNHQYDVPGYFTYFREQTRPPGYFAFDVKRWRVYALNDNCTRIDCDAELAWLDQDMAAHPRRCTAIMMHHPLFASGVRTESGSDVARPFWRVALAHGADLALAGHLHQYERLRPMLLDGRPGPKGMTQLVAGVGGASVRPLVEGRAAGSVAFDNSSAGVLSLRFNRDDFSWRYRTVDGFDIDAGRRACH
jgi:hypothetical protein